MRGRKGGRKEDLDGGREDGRKGSRMSEREGGRMGWKEEDEVLQVFAPL